MGMKENVCINWTVNCSYKNFIQIHPYTMDYALDTRLLFKPEVK